MVVYYSDKSTIQILHTTREVAEEINKQTTTCLKKVNHPKGWGAKPLV